MVFSSIFFIFYFLPVFLLLYYLVPERFRNPVLLAGSLIFYAWGEPVYLLLMLFSCFFNYYMGLELERLEGIPVSRRRNLIFTVTVNLLILGFFKYYGFLLDSIGNLFGTVLSHPDLSLPIGISFYTFKNLSYIFDVYGKKVSAQHSFLTFGVYSTMFPHMAAGPIVRYTDIAEQLKNRRISLPRLGVGAELFIKGLSKKVLLADNLSLLYTSVSASGSNSVVSAWLGIFAYTMEIYFDFSGYSDMAIGLGKMLGFDFLKNFDYPYLSTSITEFWRRWHISLGSWFRDYVYIPLGGNRVPKGTHIRNILIVWALTGLWHGASWNFILWGLYYGLLLLVEKYALKNLLTRIPPWAANLYTMLAVMLGWVFFSQTDFASMGNYLLRMFGITASCFADKTALYYLKTGLVLSVVSLIACRPGLYQGFKRLTLRNRKTACAVNIALLLLCIAYMVYNSYTPFLYLQF
ncbi:MBOAT family protein [Ruminococcus sp. 5_1_39BFAA]|uniref:MBOAT family O-acyltransferase n=1 Tax=Ruminococcus sp. 5_1_39BFAA TaxID=457412 RepID=UPI0035627F87